MIALSAELPLLLLAMPAARLQTALPDGDWLPRGFESTDALRDLRAMGKVGVVQAVRVLLELPEDVGPRASGVGRARAASPRRSRVTRASSGRAAWPISPASAPRTSGT